MSRRDQIVRYYRDNTGYHGFLETGASVTQIDVPDATLTSAIGINDASDIVGTFPDDAGLFHGLP